MKYTRILILLSLFFIGYSCNLNKPERLLINNIGEIDTSKSFEYNEIPFMFKNASIEKSEIIDSNFYYYHVYFDSKIKLEHKMPNSLLKNINCKDSVFIQDEIVVLENLICEKRTLACQNYYLKKIFQFEINTDMYLVVYFKSFDRGDENTNWFVVLSIADEYAKILSTESGINCFMNISSDLDNFNDYDKDEKVDFLSIHDDTLNMFCLSNNQIRKKNNYLLFDWVDSTNCLLINIENSNWFNDLEFINSDTCSSKFFYQSGRDSIYTIENHLF